MQPVRIQRSRKHKQVSPNGLPVVYVGRPSKWGNPFKVKGEKGNWFVLDEDDYPLFTFTEREDALIQCLNNFENYISDSKIDVKQLSYKNLSCWCKIGDKCHADILIKLANQK